MDSLDRFARAAHRFCVFHGHTSGNAVNAGVLCNPTTTTNMHSERIQLQSAFPTSEHKGLVRRALSFIPGAFTFIDDHKLYANRAFSFA